MEFTAEIRKHAKAEAPKEACGFLLRREDGLLDVQPCRNIAREPEQGFEIHNDDYNTTVATNRLVGYYHSHPREDQVKTWDEDEDDKVSARASGLGAYLYHLPSDTFDYYSNERRVAPFIGRNFTFGILDCFTLVADYYQQIMRFKLPYFPRSYKEVADGSKTNIRAYCEAAAMVAVSRPQEHDVICMSLHSSGTVNHVAVCVKDGNILHQLQHQPSREERYTDYWRKQTVLILRHKSLI